MGAVTPKAASSAVPPHVDDPAEPIAAGGDGASAQVPQNATEPPPTTGGYDWDAATAAALTDESADRVAPPHVHTTTTADRLLEDIIREIVGDAAVDGGSSQRSDQSTPSGDAVRPTTTLGSEAASAPSAVANTHEPHASTIGVDADCPERTASRDSGPERPDSDGNA